MLTLEDIQEANGTIEYIMQKHATMNDATRAFTNFIMDFEGDEHLDYIGKLIKGRTAVVAIGGSDPSSLQCDMLASVLMEDYNNEVMEQLDVLFWIACLRQQLPLPSDMRSDVNICLNYLQHNIEWIKDNSDEMVGRFFYESVRRMMDPNDPNNQ